MSGATLGTRRTGRADPGVCLKNLPAQQHLLDVPAHAKGDAVNGSG
jgi:hypothetical protein